jgi:hypothetical protein
MKQKNYLCSVSKEKNTDSLLKATPIDMKFFPGIRNSQQKKKSDAIKLDHS